MVCRGVVEAVFDEGGGGGGGGGGPNPSANVGVVVGPVATRYGSHLIWIHERHADADGQAAAAGSFGADGDEPKRR